jgi:hypothetical protein
VLGAAVVCVIYAACVYPMRAMLRGTAALT